MEGGRPIIRLVGIRPDGTLFETWIEEINGRFHWHSAATIPASPADGEPGLAVSHDGTRMALAYRGRDGFARFRLWSATQWGPEQHVMTNGWRTAVSSGASPSLAFVHLPSASDVTPVNSERLVGAFTSRLVRLYTFTGGQNWTPLPLHYDDMPPFPNTSAVGRPAIAWVSPPVREVLPEKSPSPEPATISRLYVFYIQRGAPAAGEPKPDPVRIAMSYVDQNGTRQLGLDSYFDNLWSFAYGIDALQPSDVGVRLAETYAIRHEGWKHQVYVRPHADGITNLPYRNWDDWKVMAWGACATLASVQTPQPKVNCAPKSW
jgi:hypothetical protein